MKSILSRTKSTLFAAVIVIATLSALIVAHPSRLVNDAQAATTNYPTGVQVVAMPIHLSGTYTTTVTPVKFQIPYAARLIGFSAYSRTVSGTMTIDLQAGGVSLLSAPISASTTIQEATVATAAVADESAITVVLTASNGPSFTDITVMPIFTRQ